MYLLRADFDRTDSRACRGFAVMAAGDHRRRFRDPDIHALPHLRLSPEKRLSRDWSHTEYRTEDGQSWTVVREIHDDVHNYPRALYFWNENSGVILTNYHGYDACVYLTLDGGTSWAPVPIEPHGVPAGYNYLEGERAWLEGETLMLELSAHYEDKEPVMFRVSADIP